MFLTSLLLSLVTGAEPKTQNTANIDPFTQEPVETLSLDVSKSILGADLDENGIRDDVEAYLLTAYPNDATNRAIMDYAKRAQSLLTLDLEDVNQARWVAVEELQDSICLRHVTNDENIKNEILDVTFNTKERKKAYRKYNKALKGTQIFATDVCVYQYPDNLTPPFGEVSKITLKF